MSFSLSLLSRLPEDTALEEIAREIALLAGIKIAREQTGRREGIPAERARIAQRFNAGF